MYIYKAFWGRGQTRYAVNRNKYLSVPPFVLNFLSRFSYSCSCSGSLLFQSLLVQATALAYNPVTVAYKVCHGATPQSNCCLSLAKGVTPQSNCGLPLARGSLTGPVGRNFGWTNTLSWTISTEKHKSSWTSQEDNIVVWRIETRIWHFFLVCVLVCLLCVPASTRP